MTYDECLKAIAEREKENNNAKTKKNNKMTGNEPSTSGFKTQIRRNQKRKRIVSEDSDSEDDYSEIPMSPSTDEFSEEIFNSDEEEEENLEESQIPKEQEKTKPSKPTPFTSKERKRKKKIFKDNYTN